jgi:hypothetical protein
MQARLLSTQVLRALLTALIGAVLILAMKESASLAAIGAGIGTERIKIEEASGSNILMLSSSFDLDTACAQAQSHLLIEGAEGAVGWELSPPSAPAWLTVAVSPHVMVEGAEGAATLTLSPATALPLEVGAVAPHVVIEGGEGGALYRLPPDGGFGGAR